MSFYPIQHHPELDVSFPAKSASGITRLATNLQWYECDKITDSGTQPDVAFLLPAKSYSEHTGLSLVIITEYNMLLLTDTCAYA